MQEAKGRGTQRLLVGANVCDPTCPGLCDQLILGGPARFCRCLSSGYSGCGWGGTLALITGGWNGAQVAGAQALAASRWAAAAAEQEAGLCLAPQQRCGPAPGCCRVACGRASWGQSSCRSPYRTWGRWRASCRCGCAYGMWGCKPGGKPCCRYCTWTASPRCGSTCGFCNSLKQMTGTCIWKETLTREECTGRRTRWQEEELPQLRQPVQGFAECLHFSPQVYF